MIDYDDRPINRNKLKEKQMRLFTYIVTHDTGFAPNPFWGYCTLATCKPRVRKAAVKGDWIVGLTSKALGHKLVYAMKVEEKITFDQYFNDSRFKKKKPDPDSDDSERKCGDNMYYREKGCLTYAQMEGDYHVASDFNRDTSSEYVLVSARDDFFYFGKDAKEMPQELLSKIVIGRGERFKFEPETIEEVIEFVCKLPKGMNAEPREFRKYQKLRCHK